MQPFFNEVMHAYFFNQSQQAFSFFDFFASSFGFEVLYIILPTLSGELEELAER